MGGAVCFRLLDESAESSRDVCGRIEAMETVWGALLSFLFVVALALSGHVETPSKEQIEQMEKAEKERAEQIEKAEKDKKEQKEKAEQKEKPKQKEKSKQKESDVWQLRQ
jgi:aconitase A